MFYDPETKYWQQQYKEGKIPQEWLDECCGETIALLNGNVMKELWFACKCVFGLIFFVVGFFLVIVFSS